MTEAMVDDALVSRVAQVLYNLTMPPLARDWEQESRGVREWYEKQARAALAIAYPAGVAAGREEAARVADHFKDQATEAVNQPDHTAETLMAVAPLAQLASAIAIAIRQRGE